MAKPRIEVEPPELPIKNKPTHPAILFALMMIAALIIISLCASQ